MKDNRIHNFHLFYHLGQVIKSLVIENSGREQTKKLNSNCRRKGQESGREEKLILHFESRSHSSSFFPVSFFDDKSFHWREDPKMTEYLNSVLSSGSDHIKITTK